MPSKSFEVQVEPTVLKWARESAGRTIGDVATRLGTNQTVVRKWEEGRKNPKINQLRILSGYYQRPLDVFLLSEPPEEPNLPEDFRKLPSQRVMPLHSETRFALRKARRPQAIATELRGQFRGNLFDKIGDITSPIHREDFMARIITQTDQSHLNKAGFCIDTSALIKLEPYYKDVFPSLWESLEGLLNEGRLVAPFEVFTEIEEKFPDDWKKWVKTHKKMFIDTGDIITKAKQIQNWYLGLTDKNDTKTNADYFVIALAQYMGSWTVVTDESRKKNGMKIPNVCDKMRIPCVNVYNFFRKCNWKY